MRQCKLFSNFFTISMLFLLALGFGAITGCAYETAMDNSLPEDDIDDGEDFYDPWPEPDPVAHYMAMQFLLTVNIFPIHIKSPGSVFLIGENGAFHELELQASGAYSGTILVRPGELLAIDFTDAVDPSSRDIPVLAGTFEPLSALRTAEPHTPPPPPLKGDRNHATVVCEDECAVRLLVPESVADDATISIFLGR